MTEEPIEVYDTATTTATADDPVTEDPKPMSYLHQGPCNELCYRTCMVTTSLLREAEWEAQLAHQIEEEAATE